MKTYEVEIEATARWKLRIQAPDATAARDLSHNFFRHRGELGGLVKVVRRVPFDVISVTAPVEVSE
jgi:hypothetical protein